MDLLEELIAAARCEMDVDLLLEGAEVADLLSGQLHRSDVAIHRGHVVGFDCSGSRQTLDLSGMVLAPGFIDGHVHIESSMVTVQEYARGVVPLGTTSVVADPHEIANVLGEAGIRYILDSSRGLPLSVYIMLPSCVPATGLETSGASLDASRLAGLIEEDGVLGIGEAMNYPGVVLRDPEVMRKIRIAGGKRIDGHAPGLSGRDLSAYTAAGIRSDHESRSVEEASEKLRCGMYIMIREGSAAKNLRDLLPLVSLRNARRFLFVSDDRHPADLLKEGHIDLMVRSAIQEGLDPILALQMASLNAAEYFGLRDLGAIAPGYRADIAVLEDLDCPHVVRVIKDGRPVAEGGSLTVPLEMGSIPIQGSMRAGAIGPGSFEIKAAPGMARVIGVVPGQIVTRSLLLHPRSVEGRIVSDIDSDVLKVAVIERHKATGNIGLGLVQGFGLRSGALATSVAHDSHNIVVVGSSDEEMLLAASKVVEMGGGLAVAEKGSVQASLPLPVAGIISDGSLGDVAEGVQRCACAAAALGCSLRDPFMTLSFLCLPVIPELKLTDRGLVDSTRLQPVPLFPGGREDAA
ncbi:MAG: adenine deaminase [Methanothrix sp.]|nr:adenine deaminase [Methanothrix sp.]